MALASPARPWPPSSWLWNSPYFSGISVRKAIETTCAFCESGPRIGNSLSTKRRSGSAAVSASMSSTGAFAVAAIVVEELDDRDLAVRIADDAVIGGVEDLVLGVLDDVELGDALLFLLLGLERLLHLEQQLRDWSADSRGRSSRPRCGRACCRRKRPRPAAARSPAVAARGRPATKPTASIATATASAGRAQQNCLFIVLDPLADASALRLWSPAVRPQQVHFFFWRLVVDDVLRPHPARRAALQLLLGARREDLGILVVAAVEIAFGGREFGLRDVAKLAIGLRQVAVAVDVLLVAVEPVC